MTDRLGTGSHSRHLFVNGVRREYLIHIPPSTNDEPRPLVLLLHGTGGTARWAMEETRFADCADRNNFIAVFPQALPPDPPAPPRFLANPPAWNAGGTLVPAHEPDDLSYFRALWDKLTLVANVDWKRAYVTGFSNGASMTFELAAHFGERIAAIAPVAGYCRITQPPTRPVPTLFIVGSADPLVPPRGGWVESPWTGEISRRPPALDSFHQWAALIGCQLPTAERDSDGIRQQYFMSGPASCIAIIVEGLGHHWPGGRGQLKRKLAGEPSDRLPANDVIWDFFRRHSLPDQ